MKKTKELLIEMMQADEELGLYQEESKQDLRKYILTPDECFKQERRYSKEDLEKAWEDGRKFEHDHNGGEGGEFTGAESFTEWFTQFKNK